MADTSCRRAHEHCYVSAVTFPDPTELNALGPLRSLLQAMDDDIARLYADSGIEGVRPRFSKALIRLHRRGAMTVRDLAAQVEVTHSAMSQTVTAMRTAGLVVSAPGPDARTRLVELTERGRALVPFLEAEWAATEAVWDELDAEVPYSLRRVVADLEAALERRPFRDRIRARIDPGAPPPTAP